LNDEKFIPKKQGKQVNASTNNPVNKNFLIKAIQSLVLLDEATSKIVVLFTPQGENEVFLLCSCSLLCFL